jgi:glycerophosphoryl diester phosphodiesterase
MHLIGHRGAAGEAPENTLGGFAYAATLPGLGGVEFDICLSRDGVLVVIHDDTVDRTTSGSGPVAAFTAAELGALGVPTLAEVLAQFPNFALYQIEIKHHAPEQYEAVARQMAGLVARTGLGERVLVISFEPAALEAVRRVAPGLRRGLLGGFAEAGEVDTALGLGCEWVSVCVGTATVAVVGRARERGLRVCCWTCNTAEELARAEELGAELVVTDRPGKWLGERSERM